jgi:hypothetical protein
VAVPLAIFGVGAATDRHKGPRSPSAQVIPTTSTTMHSDNRLAGLVGSGPFCLMAAALDHPGTRLDDLRAVVLHVVIRLRIRANLDASGGSTWRIERENAETNMFG